MEVEMPYYPASIYFKPGCTSEMIDECVDFLRMVFNVDEEHSCEVTLTENVLSALYANLKAKEDQALWLATQSELLDKQVQVLTLLVDGKVGLGNLVRIIGEHVDPDKCKEYTLRKHFGGGKRKIPGSDKLFWFENRIHRPRTLEEARAHFDALFSEKLCGVT